MGPSATDVFPEKGEGEEGIRSFPAGGLKRPGIAPSIDLDGCLFLEEGVAGQIPQGEPHGKGPHQGVSRELRGSLLGLPSATVGRDPERV